MYTKDDSDSAELIDRIIAAVIAGLCGYFLGLVLFLLLSKFFGSVLCQMGCCDRICNFWLCGPRKVQGFVDTILE